MLFVIFLHSETSNVLCNLKDLTKPKGFNEPQGVFGLSPRTSGTERSLKKLLKKCKSETKPQFPSALMGPTEGCY